MVVVPEKNVAFAVMINSEDSGARWSVFYHLLDHYLGLPSPDWTGDYQQAFDQIHGEALKAATTAQAAAHPERGPSLPLSAYAGSIATPGTERRRSPAAAMAWRSASIRPPAWPARSSMFSTTRFALAGPTATSRTPT
jgi:hypothetical protein